MLAFVFLLMSFITSFSAVDKTNRIEHNTLNIFPDPDSIIFAEPDTNNTAVEDTIIYDTVIIVKNPVVIKKEVIVIDSIEPLPFNYSIGVFASPIFNLSSQTPVSVEDQYFSELFDRTHKSKVGISAGIDADLYYKKWLISIGASYNLYREEFDHKWSVFSVDTSWYTRVDTLDEYYIVNGTDTTWMYKTDTIIQMLQDTIDQGKEYKSTNKLSYISIPVSFGYRFLMHKRLACYVKAGAVFSFLLAPDGQSVSWQDTTTVFQIKDLDIYNKFLFSVFLSLKFQYAVSTNFDVYAEPRFSANLISVYNDNHILKRKNYPLSLKFGVIYKF